MRLAHGNQLPVKPENGFFRCLLLCRIDAGIIGIDPQPGLSRGKACLVPVIPLHGRAHIVPAHHFQRIQRLLGIHAALHHGMILAHRVFLVVVLDGRKIHIGHAQLLPLVHIDRAWMGVHQKGQHGS